MRRLMSAMVLLVTIGLVTFVCAQLLAAPVTPSQPAQSATSAAPAKKVAAPRIVGDVVLVDTTANTITVSNTLNLDPKVVVKKAGKTIALADVKAGDRVSVQYKTVAGKKIATWIYVFTSAKKESTPTKQ